MLMKKIIVLSLILLVVLMGCAQAGKKTLDKIEDAATDLPKKGDVVQVSKSQIKFNIDGPAESKTFTVESDGEEVIIKTNEGVLEAAGLDSDEWCKEGANWEFTAEHEDVDASAQWVIEGIVDSGEYAGLCHVVYTAQTPLGETTMDYYFAEDKESGYFEMKLPTGQTVKQEWTG